MTSPKSPVRLLENAAATFSDRLAVVCGVEQWTYRQFANYCWRLAKAIVGLGLLPGERVAFLMPNCHNLLAASFGIPAAGCILIPLHPRLRVAELIGIVKNARPRVLFYAGELQESADLLQQQCRLEHAIRFDDDLLRGDDQPKPFYFLEEDPAEIIYTSGTTGSPKGALFTHRALYEHAVMMAGVHGDDLRVVLHNISLFHANGWGLTHAGTCVGATHIVPRRFDPQAVAQAVYRYGVTYMGLVPVMAKRMLAAGLRSEHFQTLRGVEIGGAPVNQQMIDDCQTLFGCEVFSGYGMTEAGPLIATGRGLDAKGCKGGLAAPPKVEMRIVDEIGSDVAHDGQTVGEVIVHSPAQMQGYWNCDEHDAEAFVLDNLKRPFLKTGDLAVWDEQDLLTLVDRKKDIIISGGEKISATQLETLIGKHPNVQECAVAAIPDQTWGEVPAVFALLKAGTFLSLQELQTFLEYYVSHFTCPKQLTIVNCPLPRTSSGKVLKKELFAL